MADNSVSESARVSDLEEMYDKMFEYRYTDEDEDYVETVSKPIPPCPCVEGYFSRNFDKNRGGGRGGSYRGGRGQWNRGQGNEYGRQHEGHHRGNQDQYHDNRSGGGYNRNAGYGGQTYNRYDHQDYKRPRYNDR